MREIRKVGVLGAGIMGAQIAAHLVNAGYKVILLDVIPDWMFSQKELEKTENRNHLTLKGLDLVKSLKPAAFALPEFINSIEIGSFSSSRENLKDVEWSDDLARLSEVDWIIEAVVEKEDIKRSLFQQVAEVRQPGTIVSSNTSGISLDALSQGLPDEFKKHFLGTHFFNPPRYLPLLEIIPAAETSLEVLNGMSDFCRRRLGKTVVFAKDTPGFIANRLAIPSVMKAIQVMLTDGYSIEEVDAITGKAIGWPKSATFRTLDLVGLNIFTDVVNYFNQVLPSEDYQDILVIPEFITTMVEKGWLGQKAGQGFYKKSRDKDGNRQILAINHKDLSYHLKEKTKFESINQGKNISDTAERLRFLFNAKDRVGEFLRKTLLYTLVHAAEHVEEIADNNIVAVDTALKNGFLWELGPFETWDALGVESVVKVLEKTGQSVPPIVEKVLSSKDKSFYRRYQDQGVTHFFNSKSKALTPVTQPSEIIILKDLKDQGRVVTENNEASLIDLSDGVLCLEFHSKMNALGSGAISMMKTALNEVKENKDWKGLVIGNQGENFSVGANLDLVKECILNDEFDELELLIKSFQDVNMGFKYLPKPVVAAPHGYTFGGACEVCLHADVVCAALETYIGLVEVGVGIVPAAGGTKEMLIRNLTLMPETTPGSPEIEPLPFIQRALETIGMAKVSTSAFEAKKLGYLRPNDVVVMNKSHLITEAKNLVITLARNYQPPKPQSVTLYGQRVYNALKLGLFLWQKAGQISKHDGLIASQLVEIFTGGNLSEVTKVSEQYLLDQEKKAFLFLCQQPKTQERIAHTLKTGKPLRN